MPPSRRMIPTYTPSPRPTSTGIASRSPLILPDTGDHLAIRESGSRVRAQTYSSVTLPAPCLLQAHPTPWSSTKPQPVRARARTISDLDQSVEVQGDCKKGRHATSFSPIPSSSASASSLHTSAPTTAHRILRSPSRSSPSGQDHTYMTRSRPVSVRPHRSAPSTSHRRLNIPSNHNSLASSRSRLGVTSNRAANKRLVIDILPRSNLDPVLETSIPSPSFSPCLTTEINAMSFLNPATNYLAAKVEVVFEQNGVVEMVGSPNTGCSYSLPGHILLTLPSLPRNIQGRRREVRDLSLQMESMSDYFDEHGRYTPFRIHESTSSVIQESLILPSENLFRPIESRVQVTVPFDLRLPGWLPASHASRYTNVCHGVIARAAIGWQVTSESSGVTSGPGCSGDAGASDPPSYSYSTSQAMEASRRISTRKSRLDHFFLNSSLSARTAAASSSKFTPLTIIRHRLPWSIVSTRATNRNLTVQPETDKHSPTDCIVICPEWVDINSEERHIRIAIRLRAKTRTSSEVEQMSRSISPSPECSSASSSGLESASQADFGSTPMIRSTACAPKKVVAHLTELAMVVEEVERFNSQPITAWGQAFPVPKNQPNRAGTAHPLISPRSPWADVGVILQNDARPYRSITSRPCLLGDDGKQRSFLFANDGLVLSDCWRKVNVLLPMPDLDEMKERVKNNRPRSEFDSPFLRVRHNLKIKMVCRDGYTGLLVDVMVTVPIRFGSQPTTHPRSVTSSDPKLPAYVQLFHENGDLRECDPLPLYTKVDAPEIEREQPMESSISTPNHSPPLPPTKPVSAGVAPLPPLPARSSRSVSDEMPHLDDDYPMDSDSSESESSGSESESEGDSDSASDSASSSDISASSDSTSDTTVSSRTSISSLPGEDEIEASHLSSAMVRRVLREWETQGEEAMERLRRAQSQHDHEMDRAAQRFDQERERERERETRSQAPPPTPFPTPGTTGMAQQQQQQQQPDHQQAGRKPGRVPGTPRSRAVV